MRGNMIVCSNDTKTILCNRYQNLEMIISAIALQCKKYLSLTYYPTEIRTKGTISASFCVNFEKWYSVTGTCFSKNGDFLSISSK